MIAFKCPICDADISAPGGAAGVAMKCPKCQDLVRVPGKLPATATPPDEEPGSYQLAVALARISAVLTLLAAAVGLASAFLLIGRSPLDAVFLALAVLAVLLSSGLITALAFVIVDIGRNVRDLKHRGAG